MQQIFACLLMPGIVLCGDVDVWGLDSTLIWLSQQEIWVYIFLKRNPRKRVMHVLKSVDKAVWVEKKEHVTSSWCDHRGAGGVQNKAVNPNWRGCYVWWLALDVLNIRWNPRKLPVGFCKSKTVRCWHFCAIGPKSIPFCVPGFHDWG